MFCLTPGTSAWRPNQFEIRQKRTAYVVRATSEEILHQNQATGLSEITIPKTCLLNYAKI